MITIFGEEIDNRKAGTLISYLEDDQRNGQLTLSGNYLLLKIIF